MSIKTGFIIVLAALLGLFVYFKVAANGDPNSYFNQTTRFRLGRHPLWRSILGLHNAGDARAEYLNGGSPVVVEVVQVETSPLSDEVINNFTDKVKQYLGKDVSLFNVDRIPDQTLTEADLAKVVDEKRRHYITGQPNLFIIVASDYAPRAEGELGRTYREFGIVLSMKALKDFTSSYPNALNDYTRSTLLHEFGRQVGLGYNNDTSCIMNEKAGISGHALEFYGKSSPQDFCQSEIDQINNIKLNLQTN